MPPLLADLPPYLTLRRGALANAAAHLDLHRRVLVVTDADVPPAYAQALTEAAAQSSPAAPPPIPLTLPSGEATKCPALLAAVHRALLKRDFTRRDCVIAVGGGVIGDLAGFAAATYMRGIDFYNVPTTLLAQLDSSIGGKTAIDFEGVKNVIGAFHPPRHVLIDPDVLDTLPPRQLRAGLAEAIKMAATSDPALFALLERSTDLRADLPEIIRRALLVKATVVAADPYEANLRRVLNFGHTLGHAIEAAARGDLLHGECVAISMLPFAGPALRPRLAALLRKYGLPTTSPLPPDVLRPFLLHDKKATASAITAVFADEVGTFRFQSLPPDEILARLPP